MTRLAFDGRCDRGVFDDIGLTDGPIVSDDAELDDGSGIDGASVGFFTYATHARLLGLFADGELVLDVVARCGHLLDGDILVGDAVFRGGCRSEAGGTAVVGLCHVGTVLGGHGSGAAVDATHCWRERGVVVIVRRAFALMWEGKAGVA
jgi:hypothetical protein